MRNKLTELALQALGDDFFEHGAAVIAQVRRERPHHYLSIIASLMPRQLNVERSSPLSDLSDEELHQLEEMLAALRARTVRQINGVATVQSSDENEQQEE